MLSKFSHTPCTKPLLAKLKRRDGSITTEIAVLASLIALLCLAGVYGFGQKLICPYKDTRALLIVSTGSSLNDKCLKRINTNEEDPRRGEKGTKSRDESRLPRGGWTK